MENNITEKMKNLDELRGIIPENIMNIIISNLSDDSNIGENLLLWCRAVISYYDTESDDEPLISDSEFDQLQENLLSLNNREITDFINESIYRNGKFEKYHYEQEMISLYKIHYKGYSSLLEMSSFFNKNRSNQDTRLTYYYSPKFDGCSLKITRNRDDDIIQIITRGGIDVTETFKTIPDIVNAPKRPIVCGELLISKLVFAQKYSSEVGGNYENPRNFVGGLVKKKDIPQDILDDLSFVPCTDGINPLENALYQLYTGTEFLTTIWKEFTPEVNLEQQIQQLKSDNFKFLCDGIVIGYREPYNIRNVKDNYPLNMVAIKFPAPRAQTEVIGFDWTQKKSGKLTPRLILKPVRLDGSTISYANGYNIEQVEQKGIGIGSIVEIEKSGDIIPIVVKVLKHSSNIQYPDVEFTRIGKHLVAINTEESRKFKFIKGLEFLQLQGIGTTMADKIGSVLDYDILEVFNPQHKIDIVKSFDNFNAAWIKFSEVYNIKSLYLDELINILQFDNVGPKISKKVALLLMKMSNDTANISSDVLANVCRGRGFIQIQEAMARLNTYGIKILRPVEVNEDTITFEMSGSPNGMTKQEFEKKFKVLYPNAVHTSLTKDTKLLIVDTLSSNTSKMLKARKYNIPQVTYQNALEGKLPTLR